MTALPICFRLRGKLSGVPSSRACAKTGKSIAARMAIIAITTSNSINVNAKRFVRGLVVFFKAFIPY
jgi:hypothetical protein